jgi:integrase
MSELAAVLSRLAATKKRPGAASTARARHRRSQLPCTPDLTNLGLQRGLLLRLLSEQLEAEVKDKSYQQTPIGDQVRQFLDDLRWDKRPENTLNTYERVLAYLSLEFDYLEGVHGFCSPDGLQLLKGFYTRRWGDAEASTRHTYVSAGRSFGNWAEEHSLCPYNPFRKVKMPSAGETRRRARPRDEMRQLLTGQDSLRDECALGLFVCLALRKNDGRMLQVGDIDLSRNEVELRHRKGGHHLVLPIGYPWLEQSLYLHIQGEGRNPREYLIYPKNDRSRPMDPSSFHRWFKRCLERAGLDSFPLHELRHTAGDDLFHRTGNIVAAQMLLGHKSIETTRRYLHPSDADLRAWMQKDAWVPEEA